MFPVRGWRLTDINGFAKGTVCLSPNVTFIAFSGLDQFAFAWSFLFCGQSFAYPAPCDLKRSNQTAPRPTNLTRTVSLNLGALLQAEKKRSKSRVAVNP